jgi:hypothetical protein
MQGNAHFLSRYMIALVVADTEHQGEGAVVNLFAAIEFM